jgi:molecular chaperone DnaJ
MSKRDYYSVLGIDRNADQSSIKKAYRKLAKEKHPDSGGDEEEFKEINEAYEVLSDEQKKSNYDRFGHSKPNQGGYAADFKDMFSHFGFGNNRRAQSMNKRGSDLRLNIKVSLEEIYEGAIKTIKYNRQSACMTCNSVGGSEPMTCIRCNGNGVVTEEIRTPFGIMQNVTNCQLCQGDGVVHKNRCQTCNGQGVMNKEEIIDIKVPVGVQDGMSMVFQGMGQAIKNGTSGSLVVNFNEVPHKKYVRFGNDLRYTVKLPYYTLVLGGETNIETIDGSKIKIKVPELNNIGDTLRVSGKGMKVMNSELRGDLMINLDIDMPKEINDLDRELLEKMKNIDDSVVEM